MRFLLDESADFPLADVLGELGHDVTTIMQDYTRAIEDVDVLAIARSEGRIVITNDLDFGELVVRYRLPHSGVILFRLETTEDLEPKRRWLARILTDYVDVLDQFLIVTERGVRVRRTESE